MQAYELGQHPSGSLLRGLGFMAATLLAAGPAREELRDGPDPVIVLGGVKTWHENSEAENCQPRRVRAMARTVRLGRSISSPQASLEKLVQRGENNP